MRGKAMDLFLPLKRYAQFSGRSRRREFWAWVLLFWVAMIVCMYLDVALGLGGSATSSASGGQFSFNVNGGVVTLVFMLAMLIPNLALTVRRLHDAGKSGWMLLLLFVPVVGWLYLLFLYVQPGTTGPNAYGADPKGQVPGEVFA